MDVTLMAETLGSPQKTGLFQDVTPVLRQGVRDSAKAQGGELLREDGVDRANGDTDLLGDGAQRVAFVA